MGKILIVNRSTLAQRNTTEAGGFTVTKIVTIIESSGTSTKHSKSAQMRDGQQYLKCCDKG